MAGAIICFCISVTEEQVLGGDRRSQFRGENIAGVRTRKVDNFSCFPLSLSLPPCGPGRSSSPRPRDAMCTADPPSPPTSLASQGRREKKKVPVSSFCSSGGEEESSSPRLQGSRRKMGSQTGWVGGGLMLFLRRCRASSSPSSVGFMGATSHKNGRVASGNTREGKKAFLG